MGLSGRIPLLSARAAPVHPATHAPFEGSLYVFSWRRTGVSVRALLAHETPPRAPPHPLTRARSQGPRLNVLLDTSGENDVELGRDLARSGGDGAGWSVINAMSPQRSQRSSTGRTVQPAFVAFEPAATAIVSPVM